MSSPQDSNKDEQFTMTFHDIPQLIKITAYGIFMDVFHTFEKYLL